MTHATETRRESYLATQERFTEQEETVIRYLNFGINHAWGIAEKSGMLITSVRRALTDLLSKGKIIETGKLYHEPTERNVTTYAVKQVRDGLF